MVKSMRLNIKKFKALENKLAMTEQKLLSDKLIRIVQSTNIGRTWDGLIHPSALNWKSKPETQLKKMTTTYQNSDKGAWRYHIGNIFHTEIQRMVNIAVFDGKSKCEDKLYSSKHLFSGSPDQWGETEEFGRVLIEYKTHNAFKSDRPAAERYAKNELGIKSVESELIDRLAYVPNIIKEPKAEHMTQIFTYAMFLHVLKKSLPNYAIICYINTTSGELTEFVYDVKDSKEYLQMAAHNYREVYRLVLEERKKYPEFKNKK